MDISFLKINNLEIYLLFNFLISLSFLIILFFFKDRICNKLKLIDYPDEKRKLHGNPTPLGGGLFLFSYLILFIALSDIEKKYFFVFWIFSFFLIGLIDDIKKLSSTIKLVSIIVILLIFFYFDDNLLIYEFYSNIISRNINLNFKNNFFLPIFFTILCCLLFFNAMNMIDGQNGICSITFFIYFISIILIFPIFENLYEILILCLSFLIIFIFFNLKGKIFLGDSGNYLLSSIFIYYILNLNHINNGISGEKIFLLMSIPGLDMFRLFIQRLLNKQNPFNPDRKHLHHQIKDFLKNDTKSLIFFTTLILISIIFIFLFDVNYIIGIFSICLIYIIVITYLKRFNF